MGEGAVGEGDLSDLKELRELVEFLKASGVAQFDMERPELKIKLKFTGAETQAAVGTGLDLAQLAQLLGAGRAAVPMPTLPGMEASASEPAHLAPVPSVAAEAQADAEPEPELHIVKSPLVGTFYDAPSPGSEPFVKVGDTVSLGKVLCIVEAMKIMNEIECDAAGEVVKMLVRPGQPVEYGQALFAIRQ